MKKLPSGVSHYSRFGGCARTSMDQTETRSPRSVVPPKNVLSGEKKSTSSQSKLHQGPKSYLGKNTNIFESENFNADDVALHFVSLYFIRQSTNKVIDEVEATFARHYAMIQKKLLVRGLLCWIIFWTITIAYDVMSKGEYNAFTVNSTDQLIFDPPDKSMAYTTTLVMRFSMLYPLIVINIYTAYKSSYKVHMIWTWLAHITLGIFPIVYNILTYNFGVSWFCLVIMYIQSCTPLRFLHSTMLSAALLASYGAALYFVLLYNHHGDDRKAFIFSSASREWLWAIMFFIMISFPRYEKHTKYSDIGLNKGHDNLVNHGNLRFVSAS